MRDWKRRTVWDNRRTTLTSCEATTSKATREYCANSARTWMCHGPNIGASWTSIATWSPTKACARSKPTWNKSAFRTYWVPKWTLSPSSWTTKHTWNRMEKRAKRVFMTSCMSSCAQCPSWESRLNSKRICWVENTRSSSSRASLKAIRKTSPLRAHVWT